MEIKKILLNYQEKIRNQTEVLIKDLTSRLQPSKLENVNDLNNILKDFMLTGKLIRGSLYLWMSNIYGRKNINNLVNVAVAIEVNHSGLLIHDDIMDNDSLRRGKPTIHLRYQSLASAFNIDKKEEFGRDMAICLGDICFLAANLFIQNSKISSNLKEKLIDYFNFQIIKTGLSQMLDVQLGLSKNEPSLKEILKVYEYKTANYTFKTPLVLGYLSANGQKTKEIGMLENLGQSWGLIFQITDDLIGFLKDEKTIGKTTGSDIRENKKTIIRYFLFKKITNNDLIFVRNSFGNKQLTEKELEKLRSIFYLRKIDRVINNYLNKEREKAVKTIEKLAITKEDKKLLINFTDYLINRSQ